MKGRIFLYVLAIFILAGNRIHAQQQCDTNFCYIPTLGDSVAEFAQDFLGKPYNYANCTPEAGFDCSGLTYYVFRHFGINVPRSAKDYMHFGKDIPIGEAQRGDIIVFRGTHPNDPRAGHVGIVISYPGEPLKFIHASSSTNHKGVVITDYYHSNYPKRFIKIIRVTGD